MTKRVPWPAPALPGGPGRSDLLRARDGRYTLDDAALAEVMAGFAQLPADPDVAPAMAALGLPPEQVALVAVHAWDCHAAKRAGLMVGWAARLEGEYGQIFTPADVTGADLIEVAAGLLAGDVVN